MSLNSSSMRYERILLIAYGFALWAFYSFFYALALINLYNRSVAAHQRSLIDMANGSPTIRFSIDNFSPSEPAFLHIIATLLICLTLMSTKRYRAPLILTVLYAALFVFSLWARSHAIYVQGGNDALADFGVFDCVAVVTIPILLIWLTSLFWRFGRSARKLA